MVNKLFREINIWKTVSDNELSRFRVFEDFSEHRFFVQGKDFFHYPINEELIKDMAFYAVDSLFQATLNTDVELFDSIEEAIKKFEEDFS